jgi:methyl-accepting chemotaxis protein
MPKLSFQRLFSASLRLDLYILFIIAPFAGYFIGFGAQLEAAQIPELLVGVGLGAGLSSALFDYVKYVSFGAFGRRFAALEANTGRQPQIAALQADLLNYPFREMVSVVARWLLSIAIGGGYLAWRLKLSALQLSTFAMLPVFSVPYSVCLTFFLHESTLSSALAQPLFWGVAVEVEKVRTFSTMQRTVLMIVSVAWLPVFVIGYFLVLAVQFGVHFQNLPLHFGFILTFTAAAIAATLFESARSSKLAVQTIEGAIRRMQAGDFTQTAIAVVSTSELGLVAGNLGQLAGQLQSSLRRVQSVAGKVLEDSHGVMSTTAQLAAAAAEQAASIAETTATVAELKMAGEISMNAAKQIAGNSESSVASARGGLAAVETSVAEIKRIFEQVESIVAASDTVRARLNEVDEVVAIVTKVADQSNLLAVNASIEAAKAGEFGRGFAVVAQEVKHLAEQSSKATTQVRSTLASISLGIDDVVQRARTGRERAEAGVGSIEHTGRLIREIGDAIDKSAGSAKQIALAASEQSVGLDQIAQAMDAINQAATENHVSSATLQTSGQSLNQVATELQRLVSTYRLAE